MLGLNLKRGIHLIDTHCHIDDPRFDIDRAQCMADASSKGITNQIVPAIKATWWPRVKEICSQWSELRPAYGLHPVFEPDHQFEDIEHLKNWLEREQPIAIGECGLDFFIDNHNKSRQIELFELQVALALEKDLPLIIHARKSVEEVLQIVKKYPGVTGICHSYSGSLQQALQLYERGFLLGFGGPVTYSRATRLQAMLKKLPLEALALETDAPDQPPLNHHGQRNQPAYLAEISAALSQILDISEDHLRAITEKNSARLFRLTD